MQSNATGKPKKYEPIRSVESLQRHLQWALSVELSTIPPYLCALYSIADPGSPAAALVRSVAIEEMLHMMLACNLLNSIGATPCLREEDVPHYPGFIPHHAAGGPFIQLQPLSPELVRTVFMVIEEPGPPGAPPEGDDFQTIGQFYDAIREGFEWCVRHLGEDNVFRDTGFQRRDTYFGGGGGNLLTIHCLEDALRAIDEITEQGEGSELLHPPAVGDEPYGAYEHYGQREDGTYGPILGTPWEMSHYQKFRQIANGEVECPAVFPMAPNPDGKRFHRHVRQLSHLFDECYTLVLRFLQRAFSSPHADVDFFAVAFPLMQHALPALATLLTRTPTLEHADPMLGPNAGPSFHYRHSPLAKMIHRAERLATEEPPGAYGTELMLVWQETLRNVTAVLLKVQEVLGPEGEAA